MGRHSKYDYYYDDYDANAYNRPGSNDNNSDDDGDIDPAAYTVPLIGLGVSGLLGGVGAYLYNRNPKVEGQVLEMKPSKYQHARKIARTNVPTGKSLVNDWEKKVDMSSNYDHAAHFYNPANREKVLKHLSENLIDKHGHPIKLSKADLEHINHIQNQLKVAYKHFGEMVKNTYMVRPANISIKGVREIENHTEQAKNLEQNANLLGDYIDGNDLYNNYDYHTTRNRLLSQLRTLKAHMEEGDDAYYKRMGITDPITTEHMRQYWNSLGGIGSKWRENMLSRDTLHAEPERYLKKEPIRGQAYDQNYPDKNMSFTGKLQNLVARHYPDLVDPANAPLMNHMHFSTLLDPATVDKPNSPLNQYEAQINAVNSKINQYAQQHNINLNVAPEHATSLRSFANSIQEPMKALWESLTPGKTPMPRTKYDFEQYLIKNQDTVSRLRANADFINNLKRMKNASTEATEEDPGYTSMYSRVYADGRKGPLAQINAQNPQANKYDVNVNELYRDQYPHKIYGFKFKDNRKEGDTSPLNYRPTLEPTMFSSLSGDSQLYRLGYDPDREEGELISQGLVGNKMTNFSQESMMDYLANQFGLKPWEEPYDYGLKYAIKNLTQQIMSRYLTNFKKVTNNDAFSKGVSDALIDPYLTNHGFKQSGKHVNPKANQNWHAQGIKDDDNEMAILGMSNTNNIITPEEKVAGHTIAGKKMRRAESRRRHVEKDLLGHVGLRGTELTAHQGRPDSDFYTGHDKLEVGHALFGNPETAQAKRLKNIDKLQKGFDNMAEEIKLFYPDVIDFSKENPDEILTNGLNFANMYTAPRIEHFENALKYVPRIYKDQPQA